MTFECRFIVWIHVQRLVMTHRSMTADMTGRMKSHVRLQEIPYMCYGEGCVRLMRSNPYIANMAHFYDTDGPCFPPASRYVWSWKAACQIWIEFILLNKRYALAPVSGHPPLNSPWPSVHCLWNRLSHFRQGLGRIILLDRCRKNIDLPLP